MENGVFKKATELKPSAMATVAERRFDAAAVLAATGQNARANGVAYLAGFVIEILLKAQLVKKYAAIARKRPHELADDEREVWSLIWRRHDLEAMLERLPELEAAVDERSRRAGTDYTRALKGVCSLWSIQARYSTHTLRMDEATTFLDQVRDLKEVLK